MKTANACFELTDIVIGWIFHVTDVEREWSVFPQTVAFLLILSYVGSFFDLPTLCIGNNNFNPNLVEKKERMGKKITAICYIFTLKVLFRISIFVVLATSSGKAPIKLIAI